MFIAWHENKFVPILAETVEFEMSQTSDHFKLTADHELHKEKTNPYIRLNYKLRISA